jgi:hypothetical protein
MSTFRINEFMSEINKRGVMKTNLFNVMIAMPACMKSKSKNQDRTNILSLRCSGASIPGVNLIGKDFQKYGYGLSERFITNAILNDITLEFVVDQKFVMDFFEEWTLGITDYSRLKSMDYKATSADNVLLSGKRPYFTNYKSNYTTTILINVYDETAERIKTVELTEAFPTRINAVNLNWDEQNRLAKLIVSFNYRDMIYHYLGSDEFRIETKTDRLFGKIDKIVTGASILTSGVFGGALKALGNTIFGK